MVIEVDEHIKLELIAPRHAEALCDLARNNKEQLAEWLPWVPKMQTPAHFEAFSIEANNRFNAGVEIPLVILQDDILAGRIGVYNIDRQNKIISIGYWLGSNFQGKGIVSRSTATVVEHAFSVMHMNRVEIRCGQGNIRSQAIAIKLGFQKEGTLRQAEFVNEKFIDIVLYAMLKENWQSSPNQPDVKH